MRRSATASRYPQPEKQLSMYARLFGILRRTYNCCLSALKGWVKHRVECACPLLRRGAGEPIRQILHCGMVISNVD